MDLNQAQVMLQQLDDDLIIIGQKMNLSKTKVMTNVADDRDV